LGKSGSIQDVTTHIGVDAGEGLATAEVERRLPEYGPNELATEPPPSMWVMAREQLMDPMNIMLLIVVAPAVVAVDKAIQLRRQNKAPVGGSAELKASPAAPASTR
jgi:magnesium-transporting ATPase (P-type)